MNAVPATIPAFFQRDASGSYPMTQDQTLRDGLTPESPAGHGIAAATESSHFTIALLSPGGETTIGGR